MSAPLRHGKNGIARRASIVICGGGVAAIESVLAVRALLGLAARVDLVAPNRRFVYEPLAVAEPFGRARSHRFDLAAVAAEHGVRLHIASLEAADPHKHRIALSDGVRLYYDNVVVAIGARRCTWLPGALHFTGAADVDAFRGLLHEIAQDGVARLAFAAPPGVAWTLPTYELALLTASWIAERRIVGVELTVVTPEPEPLAVFGATASRAVRDVLGDRGIRVRVNTAASAVEPGVLRLTSGEAVEADRVVALAQLRGPGLAGLPADPLGFIPVDDHARVIGCDNVYAAGDATTVPVKQGGLATQQADVAVETLVARLGAGPEPAAFQPTLRAMLLTGVGPAYLRAAVGSGSAGRGELAAVPLWWPPTKVAGRYLGPYVTRSEGDMVGYGTLSGRIA